MIVVCNGNRAVDMSAKPYATICRSCGHREPTLSDNGFEAFMATADPCPQTVTLAPVSELVDQ